MSRNKVTLSRAAVILRLSYHQVQRLVMRGDLRGGQDDQRHWWVDADDVARLAQHRAERQVA